VAVNSAYRHGDYPVAINEVFARRIQDITLDKSVGSTPYSEISNFGAVGTQQDLGKFSGSLRWFPIDNQIENLFTGHLTSGSVIDLAAMLNMSTGVTVKTLKAAVSGCKVTSLEYLCQAGGEFVGALNYEGLTWATSGSFVTARLEGLACYKSKDVAVSVGGIVGVRVSDVAVRVNIPTQGVVEIGNTALVGLVQDVPAVSAEITFYESDLMAGNVEALLAEPKDIVLVVGGANALRYTLKSMISGPGIQNQRGNVNGWATRKYSYQAGNYDASYGLSVAYDTERVLHGPWTVGLTRVGSVAQLS
jgi:hypothetical protein